MKILFLAPRLPVPADTGGKIRTLNILRQLTRFAEVDLVCFSFEDDDKEHARSLRQEGVEVHLVPVTTPTALEKLWIIAFAAEPYTVKKYHQPRMAETLRRLYKENSYDVVHIDHVHMAHDRTLFTGQTRILDEHNVEHMILERYAAVEKSALRRAVIRCQAAKMKRFEKTILRDIDACLAVSAEDRAVLEQLSNGQCPVAVVPNGVDTRYFDTAATAPAPDQDKAGQAGKKLVFTGSMDWWPNDDAMRRFCEDTLPLIRREEPGVALSIIGKDPSPALRALGRDQNIELTGRVPDVRPYIAAAGVYIVPIRVGGGTRLKILEAMAMRKPVVSTTVGAEGINYANGENIILADTPQDFAARVLELLANPARARQIGTNARDLVLREYDWDVVGRMLKKVYEK